MHDQYTAVLLIMDGLGDRPVPELDGKTPLQVANTPNFDRLAENGQSGLLNVLGHGITPGSDAAHLTLFGYDYHSTYPGRGPLEALGAGLSSKPGDVAFRSNFATVDENMVVLDRRAGRTFTAEEHRQLEEALSGIEIDGVKVKFIATSEHRGAIVLEGKDLSGQITDNDPHETGKKVLDCVAEVPVGKRTAEIVNKLVQLTNERLRDLEVNKKREERGLPPANILLLRGAGQHEVIPTLESKYGISSVCLAGGALYIGCAKYVGMEHVPVEGQTGTIDTNFDNIAMKAIEVIEKGTNYLFIHIKATDNASHDGNYEQKILAIERADQMIGKIVDKAGERMVIAITGDHTTPVTVGEHMCDPVPLLLWSKFIRSDQVTKFSEVDASSGALHTLQGIDVMPLLLGYAGYIEKVGA